VPSNTDLTSEPGVSLLATGQIGETDGPPPAQLLEVQATDLTDRMLEECFGPVTIMVRYENDAALAATIDRLPSSLTATIHTGSADSTVTEPVRQALEARAGRVVYNGFPTGVSVSWAQHHGGGWPASNSLHTSVGATAVRRFLRPLAWQAAPESALPLELRDTAVDIPRRVDGVLQPATG
jgi:NADP-dependent aldehyde dehydrogenase